MNATTKSIEVTSARLPIPASAGLQEAMLGAFNASNLAGSYIERGNFSAARRKLMLALQAINEIQTKG